MSFAKRKADTQKRTTQPPRSRGHKEQVTHVMMPCRKVTQLHIGWGTLVNAKRNNRLHMAEKDNQQFSTIGTLKYVTAGHRKEGERK